MFLVDFFKGTLATLIPVIFNLGPHYLCLIFGLAAILGHAFPVFLKFKGGKAVATFSRFSIRIQCTFLLDLCSNILPCLVYHKYGLINQLNLSGPNLYRFVLFPRHCFKHYQWIACSLNLLEP